MGIDDNLEENKGKVKEGLGDAVGDPDLKREGQADQAAGSFKDKVDDAVDSIKDKFKKK